MKLIALAVTALALSVGVADAQGRKAKNATEVVITNARAAAVNGLALTNASGQSVGGISQPIAPGGKVRVRLQKNAGCELSVEASFDDEVVSGPTNIDACADKNINFKD